MSLYCVADNPQRPVNWIWQRAQALCSNQPGALPPSRSRDSVFGFKWIDKARRFIAAYNRATDDTAKALLAERQPEIFWAHRIWSDPVGTLKHSIEAQILARSPDFTIGFRCNMPPHYVEAYEALFFNVRDKLQHRSYILHVVIGTALQRGITERDSDILWKLYGYFLGPHLVDALESKFVNPMWCGTPTAVGAAVMDDAIGTLKLKAALATKTVSVNASTQLALMEAFTKFVEIERTTDTAGKAQAQILDHISAMMTTLPFSVGGRHVNNVIPMRSAMDAFQDTAIELTYEETMRLSVDHTIVHHDILKNLTFPISQGTQIFEDTHNAKTSSGN